MGIGQLEKTRGTITGQALFNGSSSSTPSFSRISWKNTRNTMKWMSLMQGARVQCVPLTGAWATSFSIGNVPAYSCLTWESPWVKHSQIGPFLDQMTWRSTEFQVLLVTSKFEVNKPASQEEISSNQCILDCDFWIRSDWVGPLVTLQTSQMSFLAQVNGSVPPLQIPKWRQSLFIYI